MLFTLYFLVEGSLRVESDIYEMIHGVFSVSKIPALDSKNLKLVF